MNPFDQFSDTLQAALPPQPADSRSVAPSVVPSQAQPQQPQFNLMAQPAQEKKPVMNSMAPAPQGGGGGMYGQPQPAMQMQQQQQQQ